MVDMLVHIFILSMVAIAYVLGGIAGHAIGGWLYKKYFEKGLK